MKLPVPIANTSLILRPRAPANKAVSAAVAAPLIESGILGYELAVRQAAGFVPYNAAGLRLGVVRVSDLPNALTAISERAKAEVKEINEQTGRNDPLPMTFSQYLRAVGRIRALTREWEDGEVVDGSHADFLVRHFDEDRHTEDGSGYANFLEDVKDPLFLAAGAEIAAELSPEDREGHTLIVGGTKSGKSELLKALVFEHLRLGDSAIVLIDPHGDVAAQVSRWPEIGDRLVLVASGGLDDRQACINPLEAPEGATSHTKEGISELFGSILREVIAQATAELSHQMSTLLQMCVRLLLDVENSTLDDLVSLCGPKPPPHLIEIGKNHSDEVVRRFFCEDFWSDIYEKTRPAVRGRLMTALSAGDFRRLTCGRTTVPLTEALRTQKLVIFDLHKSSSETAAKIARMVVGNIASFGYEQRRIPRQKRQKVHLILDEAHDYVGDSTRRIIGELRKCGVFVTFATQGLQKLDMSVREEALQSTLVKIVGRTDHSPRLLAAIGLSGKDSEMRAQQFDKGDFFVRWGPRPAFLMKVRSDLADEAHQISDEDWRALRERQKAFYGLEDAAPLPSPQKPSSRARKRVSREIEP